MLWGSKLLSDSDLLTGSELLSDRELLHRIIKVLGPLEIGAGFAGTASTGELPGAGGVQNLGRPALAVF